jgi:hypothetical protein
MASGCKRLPIFYGKTTPVPDLPTREQREDEIANALVLLFAEWDSRPFDPIAFADNLASVLESRLAAVYQEAAANFLGGMAATIPDEEIVQNASTWAAGYTPTLSSTIARTTIPDDIGAFSPARAETIAMTEVTRAISAAEMAIVAALVVLATEEGGGELEPIWYTSKRENVCPICRPLHAKSKEIWGRVAPNGPPAHPRCFCHLTWKAVE